uniref:Uncharacterized protein n=1 Tax=Peronospora matthiolae TaxID=2874970 RepID=A0AAV1T6P2_9STRA
MTPPANGESVNAVASAATQVVRSIEEAARASSQLNEALPMSAASEIAAAAASGNEEEDKMVEALENLILEAYNKMQIDGECIFLPEEVAEKLHQAAEQVRMPNNGEKKEMEKSASDGKDSNSVDVSASMDEVEEAVVTLQQQSSDRVEPEHEKEQEQDKKQAEAIETTSGEKKLVQEGTRMQRMQVLQAEVIELCEEESKQRISRAPSIEHVLTDLTTTADADEVVSSDPPSPSSPLYSQSRSRVDTSNSRACAKAQGPSHFPPPPLISLSSTPSSLAASSGHSGRTTSSRPTDQPGGGKRKSKGITYELRREAAQRLKEDKKKRELLVREAARKQREIAKRQLEELQQQKMGEKRERARRIREERLHRRAGKSTGDKGEKGSG